MRSFPFAHHLTISERHKTRTIPVRREKGEGGAWMLWSHDAWVDVLPADYTIGSDGKLRHGVAIVKKWTLDLIRISGPSGKSTTHSKRDGSRIELHLPTVTLDLIDYARATMSRAEWIRGVIAQGLASHIATNK